MLIDVLGFQGWPSDLLAGLGEHSNLRHLCVLGEITSRATKLYPKLSMEDSINQLVKAWRGRNWQTIIFITRELLEGKITLVGAECNGGGKIEYKQLHRKPSRVLLSVFHNFIRYFGYM